VQAVFAELSGAKRLVSTLLYGSGLRLLEALQLRVKDIEPQRHEIMVRSGKGGHDRITLLPDALLPELRCQLSRVRTQHTADLERGGGWVALPAAFRDKSPTAGRQLGWQWLFRRPGATPIWSPASFAATTFMKRRSSAR
jgi:integrase